MNAALEEAVELIESTANFLRGACLDSLVPEHAKAAMRNRIEKLDEFASRTLQADMVDSA